MFLVALIVLLISLLFIYNKWKHSYWSRLGVFSPKPVPFVGHMSEIILGKKHNGDVFAKIYRESAGEPYVGIYNMQRPQILIRDQELIKAILTEDFNHFGDNDFDFVEELDPLFAHNPFAQRGNNWKRGRSQMTQAFSISKMKSLVPAMLKCCEDMITNLDSLDKPEDGIEFKDVAVKYTLDVVASCAFGIQSEVYTNPNSSIVAIGYQLINTSIWNVIRFVLSFIIPFNNIFKISFIDPAVTVWLRNIIQESIEYRKTQTVKGNDFLQGLLNLKNKEGNQLTEAEIEGACFSFLSDGFETSSATLAFACYEVAKNEHVQDKLREEINTVLENHEGKWTYESLQEMKYLERVIHEALRKYPIGLVMQKRCTKDYTLPGKDKNSPSVQIKVGESVVIPVLGVHRDPLIYPNPEIFEPDRFSEEAKSTRSKYTYLGFGEGPRLCLGLRFGLAITKLALAHIVTNYNVKASSKTIDPIQIDPRYLFFLPQGGLWVKLEKRL